MLKSNLCDYHDTNILVGGNIMIAGNIAAEVAFKSCAPFIKCITKIYETTIDNADDLYLLVPIYNLLEYSSNYSDTTDSSWLYSKDEANNFNADIEDTNNFKSFKYKTKLIESTAAANGILENGTLAVPLKYLSNYWRSLEIPLINCKVELKLKWTKYCVLATGGNDNDDANSSSIIFTIKGTKLYVPGIVTSSTKDNQKLSKLLSKGFERSVYWNDIKQTVRIKTQQTSTDIFLNRILQELTNCLFWFIQIKMKMLKVIKLKDITYQMVLLRIITSSSTEKLLQLKN